MLVGLVILAIATAVGSFVGGIMSSGIVIAFLKRSEAKLLAEKAKIEAEAKSIMAEAIAEGKKVF